MNEDNEIKLSIMPQKESLSATTSTTPLVSSSKGSLASSISYVSYEAEEEPYNPRHLSCCDRLRLEFDCQNLNFSVWTSLGRLEWADAFGRGSGGCGCFKKSNIRFWCSCSPLGPGKMRNLRILLFILCFVSNAISISTWDEESPMKFTNWLTISTNIYLFFSMILCAKLHDQDNVTVEISPLGRFTWFLQSYVYAPTLAITVGYWLTHFLFADLNPTFVDGLIHGFVGFLLVVDLYFGAQPFFFVHYLYSALLPTFWLIFSVIHYYLRLGPEKEDGEHWVYPFVNWSKPERTGVVMVLIFVWVFVVHAFTWIVSRGRDVPFKHYENTLKL